MEGGVGLSSETLWVLSRRILKWEYFQNPVGKLLAGNRQQGTHSFLVLFFLSVSFSSPRWGGPSLEIMLLEWNGSFQLWPMQHWANHYFPHPPWGRSPSSLLSKARHVVVSSLEEKLILKIFPFCLQTCLYPALMAHLVLPQQILYLICMLPCFALSSFIFVIQQQIGVAQAHRLPWSAVLFEGLFTYLLKHKKEEISWVFWCMGRDTLVMKDSLYK